jgi:hypothetical protein
MKSPTNATGYSFLFKIYSSEYPEWVCTSYNDQFIALVEPPPQGVINGNISFDSNHNPVSVQYRVLRRLRPDAGQSIRLAMHDHHMPEGAAALLPARHRRARRRGIRRELG